MTYLVLIVHLFLTPFCCFASDPQDFNENKSQAVGTNFPKINQQFSDLFYNKSHSDKTTQLIYQRNGQEIVPLISRSNNMYRSNKNYGTVQYSDSKCLLHQKLPAELIKQIAFRVTAGDVIELICTCRHFRDTFNNEQFWQSYLAFNHRETWNLSIPSVRIAIAFDYYEGILNNMKDWDKALRIAAKIGLPAAIKKAQELGLPISKKKYINQIWKNFFNKNS